MNKKDVYLGIDPGTRFLGWAILDGTKSCVGQIGVSHISEIGTRLLLITHKLDEVIDKYKPSVMAIEDGFVNMKRNPSTALKLAEVRGVLKLIAAAQGLTVHMIPHATIKKFVTGSGKAEKIDVQREVQRQARLKRLPTDNQADAWGAAASVRQIL